MVRVVIKIGLSLIGPDLIIASVALIPSSRHLFILSTRTIALSTTIPTRIIIPINAGMLNVLPVISKANNAPVSAKGTVNNIVNG